MVTVCLGRFWRASSGTRDKLNAWVSAWLQARGLGSRSKATSSLVASPEGTAGCLFSLRCNGDRRAPGVFYTTLGRQRLVLNMSLWFHADNAIMENESLADDCCEEGILPMLRHSPVVVGLWLLCR